MCETKTDIGQKEQHQVSLGRRWPHKLAVSAFVLALTGVSSAAVASPPRSAGRAATAVDADQFLVSIDPPAPLGSTSPTLAAEKYITVNEEHDILMTWLEPGKTGGKLMFARRSGHTWSQPVTIAEPVAMLSPTDRPSLTVIDTEGVRRTLIARTGNVVARSGDAGRTWSRLPAPPLPFASFAGGDEGGYAFWLAAEENGSAKLLGSRVLAGETLLDPQVFDNSSTSAAMTWDGPVVVYRDQSDTGALDIALIRRQDAKWTQSHPVHVEGWRPAQSPSSGPSVAALRRRLAVVWYTEAQQRPRLLVAFSADAGRTFSTPIQVDAKQNGHTPSGPAAVALDDNGHALVVWKTHTSSATATLNLARVSADGRQGTPLVLATNHPTRLGGVPQIVRADDRVVITWLEGVLRHIRAVIVPRTDIPTLSSSPGPVETSNKTAPPSPVQGRGRVGERAPNLELVSLDGEYVSLTSLHGRPVLLNLWATWCKPCRHEMPELAKLYEHYANEGLSVVGVSIDSSDASDAVRAFVTNLKIPFAVWLDPEMASSQALRVRGLPATFVIDREGRIILRRDRTITADDPEIKKALSRALSDS